MTHRRTGAQTRSPGGGGRRDGSRLAFFRASVRLCVCALLLSCTDPRARPAPPNVQVFVVGSSVGSPGTVAVSAVVYDAQGVDSVRLSLRSPIPALQGDSLFLFPDTTDVTQSVLWTIPSGLPSGTKITLSAKAWDLLGFMGQDSVIVTSL